MPHIMKVYTNTGGVYIKDFFYNDAQDLFAAAWAQGYVCNRYVIIDFANGRHALLRPEHYSEISNTAARNELAAAFSERGYPVNAQD